MKKTLKIVGLIVLLASLTIWAFAAGQLLKNPGFELVKKGLPDQWMWVGWFNPEVKFARDTAVKHSGAASASITITKMTDRLKKFGPPNFAQGIDGKLVAGKKIKMTGYIKTQNVKGVAPIGVQCWGKGIIIKFGTTQFKQPVSGTTGWKKVTVVLDVPKNTEKVRVLCMLIGTGKVWFDDVKLEVVK